VVQAAELTRDLVLMDISMPIMNGLKATTEIIAISPNTTVVVVSGLNDADADEAGVAGWIKKSDFTVATLVEVLGK
jgi:YesN/AraC family two-component response regulator